MCTGLFAWQQRLVAVFFERCEWIFWPHKVRGSSCFSFLEELGGWLVEWTANWFVKIAFCHIFPDPLSAVVWLSLHRFSYRQYYIRKFIRMCSFFCAEEVTTKEFWIWSLWTQPAQRTTDSLTRGTELFWVVRSAFLMFGWTWGRLNLQKSACHLSLKLNLGRNLLSILFELSVLWCFGSETLETLCRVKSTLWNWTPHLSYSIWKKLRSRWRSFEISSSYTAVDDMCTSGH